MSQVEGVAGPPEWNSVHSQAMQSPCHGLLHTSSAHTLFPGIQTTHTASRHPATHGKKERKKEEKTHVQGVDAHGAAVVGAQVECEPLLGHAPHLAAHAVPACGRKDSAAGQRTVRQARCRSGGRTQQTRQGHSTAKAAPAAWRHAWRTACGGQARTRAISTACTSKARTRGVDSRGQLVLAVQRDARLQVATAGHHD